MIIKKISAILLIAGLSLLSALATPSDIQKRLFYSRVYSMLAEYELASRFTMESDANTLLRLFDYQTDAPVYMDLMGHPAFGKTLTLEEYIIFVTKNNYTIQSHFQDVRKGKMRQEGDVLVLPVTMVKKVSYYDNNEVYFSLDSFFKTTLFITVEFKYSISSGACRISSVTGDLRSGKAGLPENYTVVLRDQDSKKNGAYDDLLIKHNTGQEFDANGQYFFPGKVSDIQTWDSNIKIVPEILPLTEASCYQLVRYRYRPLNLRARMTLGIAPFAYAYQSADDVKVTSIALEQTLQFGYSFPVGSFRLMPYIGAGASECYLYMHKKGFSFSYALPSEDDETAERVYYIKRATQPFLFFDWVASLGVGTEYRVDDRFVVHGNIGGKYYFNQTTKQLDPYTVKGTVNDSPLYLTTDSYENEVAFWRRPNDVVLTLGADLDVNLLANRLFFNCGLSFDQAFRCSFVCEGNRYFDPESGIFPLKYDAQSYQEKAYSPLYGAMSLTRSALWLHLGLSVKF